MVWLVPYKIYIKDKKYQTFLADYSSYAKGAPRLPCNVKRISIHEG